MRKAAVGDAARLNRHAFFKAAFEQAVRWEWITHNAVKAARPKSRRVPPRDAMTPEVQAVIAAAAAIDPAAGLALRLAAAAGARRAEVAALQWKNFREGAVIIDHQITADRSCAG